LADNEYLTWDESFKIGIALIDKQHKELVGYINQLYRACLAGNDAVAPAFKEAMSHMVDYVRLHFNTEQELLKRINYPSFNEHKKQHDELIKDILITAKNYRDGKKFVPHNFVRTLRDWVLSHIAVHDKAYSTYIHEQIGKGKITKQHLN